jgi:hypothetical protein
MEQDCGDARIRVTHNFNIRDAMKSHSRYNREMEFGLVISGRSRALRSQLRLLHSYLHPGSKLSARFHNEIPPPERL